MELDTEKCSNCGRITQVKSFFNSEGELIGSFDPLCIYEKKFTHIPVFANYPNNKFQFIYRFVMGKNLPSDPGSWINFYFKFIVEILYFMLTIGLGFLFYYTIYDLLGPLFSILLFGLFFLIIIIIAMVNDTEKNFLGKLLEATYHPFKDRSKLYTDVSFLKFNLYNIRALIVNIFAWVAYPIALVGFSIIGVAVFLVIAVFGLMLSPLYLIFVIFRPSKELKSIIWTPFRYIFNYIKKRVENVYHLYFNGLQIKRNRRFFANAEFSRAWEQKTNIYQKPGVYYFNLLLCNIPFHALLVWVISSYRFGKLFLMMIEFIAEGIANWLFNLDSNPAIGFHFINPVTLSVSDFISVLLLTVLVLRLLEGLDNIVWNYYLKIFVHDVKPEIVIKEKISDNHSIFPTPPVMKEIHYGKFWEVITE